VITKEPLILAALAFAVVCAYFFLRSTVTGTGITANFRFSIRRTLRRLIRTIIMTLKRAAYSAGDNMM
jgi:hypothetical protein